MSNIIVNDIFVSNCIIVCFIKSSLLVSNIFLSVSEDLSEWKCLKILRVNGYSFYMFKNGVYVNELELWVF